MGMTFKRSKFSALIDGLTTVTYVEQVGTDDEFTITVNQKGMRIRGHLVATITSEKDLQDFARLISDCWKDHKKLVPKVSVGFGGFN